MTKRQETELKEITRRLSKMVGEPCEVNESNFGGTFSVWIKDKKSGALIIKLIGYAPFKELLNQYYVFHRAWNLAKDKYEPK